MLSADHPLADLQAQAALASGWPTLHVFRPSEARLLRARHVVEDLLGPLPQADVIEPWDVSDPDEPWELRIDLPGLHPAVWDAVRATLGELDGASPVLVPGLRDGARDARDQGWLQDEIVAAGGLEARMPLGADGERVMPDLQVGQADDAVCALEHEVAAALQARGVTAPFASDRGPDTLTPVVHRDTGRFGVQARFSPDALEALDGDALRALREGVVAAFADCVRARADQPVRLAPDLTWETRWGLAVTAWLIGPAAPGLPGDAPIGVGVSPFAGVVDRWTTLLPGWVEDVEVQVLPETAGLHDAVVDAVMGAAAERDLPLLGGRPRWLLRLGVDGTEPVFAPTWRVAAGRPVGDVVDALAGLPGVDAVRLVPGEPAGLGEAWQQSRPAWQIGGARWFQRIRDGLSDRDRLPHVSERARAPRDEEVEHALAHLMKRGGGAAPVARPRAIVDDAGRQGLEVWLDPRALGEAGLRRALDAAGAVAHDDLAPLGHWGYREAIPLLYLWFR